LWCASIVTLLLTLSALVCPAAATNELLRVRVGSWEDRLRIVLDLSTEVSYRYRVLTDPNRIAIDLLRTSAADVALPAVDDWMVERIRLNHLQSGTAQVVIDLDRKPSFKIFSLPPADGKPVRVVCDVFRSARPEPADAEKPWIVAIDAGHGGIDPGAVSSRPRLREKEIVLDVSRRLVAALNREPGVVARLTREHDEFVGLRERVRRAEAMQANILVSIHVNGCRHRSAKGAEVFFLSLSGATDEASRELEALENQPEVEEDPMIGEIAELPFALDLIQTDTILRSSLLGEVLLDAFSENHLAATRGVKQANFVVLRSYRVPSVLVELGFISNPEDARNLASDAHRQSLGESLAKGLLKYRARYARHAHAPAATPGSD
jgi:N-acetylmuramoyl-L-alanine amidase